MDYSEKVLCGTGEVELDPNIVSEEAGKLYAELQVRIDLFSSECFFFFFLSLYMWVKYYVHVVKHPGPLSAAVPYHRLLLRRMVKVWWSPWCPHSCGSWRGWLTARPSWEKGRRRLRGRKPSERSCWRDTKQRKLWGRKVRRWELIRHQVGWFIYIGGKLNFWYLRASWPSHAAF